MSISQEMEKFHLDERKRSFVPWLAHEYSMYSRLIESQGGYHLVIIMEIDILHKANAGEIQIYTTEKS